MKEKPISSLDNRMNEDRFADLFREEALFEEKLSDPLLKQVFHNTFFKVLCEICANFMGGSLCRNFCDIVLHHQFNEFFEARF